MRIQLGILMLCLVLGRIAQAQEGPLDPRIGEARTACIAGDYPKGVRLLAELYTATDDPIWIFNQGRCYQQNAEPALALSRFKEFLRKSKAGPDDEDVRDARKYIAELEAETRGAPSTPEAVTPEVQGAGTAGLGTSAPVDQTSQESRSPSESLTSTPDTTQNKPPIYKRWWFLTGAAAVVVAGTVTAILLSSGSGNNSVTCSSPICLEP